MTTSRRRDPDTGRVAVPEVAELLHLQRPAAAVAATAVVLLGLLLALVAPGALPANVLTGALVGVLAVLAAVGVAVVLDGRDPVLRGPRHLRRDGHTVLARMAGPDPARHGAPVLRALQRRLDGRDHLSVVLTGSGTDPSALAVALGRGAAADGHTALVIDLRATVAPGVADVGAGTVRLGEAAQLADDRPYAWIGAGVDRAAAAVAAAGVARRPPRDLELLFVVAPEAATHAPEVLEACDRTVLLVAADTQQRAMVTARVEALRRAGGRAEAVVVGGVHVVDDDRELDTGSAQPDTEPVVPPSPEPQPSPQPPPTVPEPVEPEEPEPAPAPEPAPDAPPVVVPDPTDGAADTPEQGVGSPDSGEDASEDGEEASDAAAVDIPEPAGTGTDVPADDADDDDADEQRPATPASALEDTGPIRPITFRTTGGSRTDVEGLADSDPLVTTVALEHLLAQQHRDRA